MNRTTRIITLVLLFVFCGIMFVYAQDMGLTKLDTAGNKFVYIAQKIAKWIVIVMATLEIIKCALNHDKGGAGNAVVTYGLIYGATFFVPYMMGIIEGVFQ